MKIFISHSSKDKWAARRIQMDIELLGVDTFLDEKNISTGESIDLSIQKHLSECSDFLVILSPASIRSEWVLMELGGAIALKKKIVPILLYVGANEIPHAINLNLARDINEIDYYYSEIAKTINKRYSIKSQDLGPVNNINSKNLRKGSKVIIPSVPQEDVLASVKSVAWAKGMNVFLSKKAIITETIAKGIVKLNIDNGLWFWSTEWLLKDEK